MIKDSGKRREFPSGAVRDIQEEKGRCDLLPLKVAGLILKDQTLTNIEAFKRDGDPYLLVPVLLSCRLYDNVCTMLLEVSKQFEEGAKKYGEYNWQKGIPVKCYIDSATRHYLKHLRGDKDEPHDRAFVWNIMCAAWTCLNHPELNDYRKVPVEGEESK